MTLALSQKSGFSFRGSHFFATRVSVESPQPEITDMTGMDDPVGAIVMVPTGAFTAPGRVSVDAFGFTDPSAMVGLDGEAVFATQVGRMSFQAVCESASVEAQVGELLRVSFSLLVKKDQ